MGINTLLIKVLQRYWRLRRGLTMSVQAVVLDAQGRVLLVRRGDRPSWHFPGGGVEEGESVSDALARTLAADAGVVLSGPPQLFGIYASLAMFPGDHIALFVVRKWHQERKHRPDTRVLEQGFFSTDSLPDGASGGTRRRIGEVLHGAPRSETW